MQIRFEVKWANNVKVGQTTFIYLFTYTLGTFDSLRDTSLKTVYKTIDGTWRRRKESVVLC